MFIAPTEPAELKTLGTVALLPETFGVDILFAARAQWFGIQRKELSDLISSVHDGRLGKEVSQMKRLAQGMQVVEGRPTWTLDGELVTNGLGYRWTKAQHRGLLWSVRSKGVWVDATDNIGETISLVQMFEAWMRKTKHVSLDRRPGPVSYYGKPDDHDYACHLVQGLPGVGEGLAEKIVEKYGVPFGWKISQEDLMAIPGIGKVKAAQLWAALELEGSNGNG